MPQVSPASREGSNKGQPIIASRDAVIPPLGLAGTLNRPDKARAIVIFAHGSGSSRFSPRNNRVAEAFNRRGIATLLFDLLLPEEEDDRRNVFDIKLLAQRLTEAVRWVVAEPDVGNLPIGLFGASTGAAAALVAASELGDRIGAVVSRGGRLDLAGDALAHVKVPTLLIVGGNDFGVIELNQWALQRLEGEKSIQIVPGATHLFEEAGALDCVIELASDWFEGRLGGDHRRFSKADARR
jgi:pimeloyl-ACP methyl ester carboxylesterase